MPANNKKFRFALVGCGRISQKHIEALQSQSGAIDVVAVCDTVEARASRVAQTMGCSFFNDLATLLESVSIDFLVICTPSGLHPKHAHMAAERGVNVVSEKPIGTVLKEAKDLVQFCENKKVDLFVIKQNRFNPTIQKVRQAIQQKRFDKIHMVQVNLFWTRPQEYYDQAPWRGTAALDGGALTNQASHYVDLLTWLIGPQPEVKAFTARQARKIEMEDTAAISLRWPQGTLGTISVTVLTHNKNLEGSLTILGEKGSVRIGGIALNKVDVWDFADGKDSIDDVQNISYQPDSVYGYGHLGFYKNLVKHLNGEASLVFPGSEGLHSLQLIEEVYNQNPLPKIDTNEAAELK